MAEQYDWRYENSINFTKQYIDCSGHVEHKYVPWRTNSALSNFADTVLHANEMNINHQLDSRMQYDYLFHSIRKRKRFFKKAKQETHPDFELISSIYKYNAAKTKEALSILTPEQLNILRQKQEKGG